MRRGTWTISTRTLVRGVAAAPLTAAMTFHATPALAAEGVTDAGWALSGIAAALFVLAAGVAIFQRRQLMRARAVNQIVADAGGRAAHSFLLTRRDGTPVSANTLWRGRFGFDIAAPAAGLGRWVGDATKFEWLLRALAAGEHANAEITLRDGDGDPVTLSVMPVAGDPDHGLWMIDEGGASQPETSGQEAEAARTPPQSSDIAQESQDIASVRPTVSNGAAGTMDEVFESAPCGIAIIDLLGRIVDANPAFSKASGLVDWKSGDFLKAMIATDDRDDFAAWHAGIVRQKSAPDPLSVRFAAGAETKMMLHAQPTGGPEGKLDSIIVYIIEAAESVIDIQTTQAQKMELVGQLAGGVAHDFNNLLTAMIGFCDLLLLRLSPKDQSFADIMQIKQNANRAANLVRQLLAFSRQQVLQPRVLDLTNVLAELSHLLRRLIGASIDLDMVHGRDLGLVKVDEGQLEQVIINLAVNARDAMADSEGGTLTIRTMDVPAGDPRISAFDRLPDMDYVVVEVSDTGCGIPDEMIEKIYDPFFTTKEVGEGTGLGLSTVYGIVTQTGGHIFVNSTQGAGTTFTIFLPRFREDDDTVAPRAERTEAEAHKDLTGAGTVLLVEDEDAVRMFGSRALRNKGYDVVEAFNGEAALEILESGEHELDLLITDVVMPGMDGPALIRRVRETHPDLKVIFISGYTEDTFRKRLDAGARVHFLPKPFSLQQLAGKVKEVMQTEEDE